MDGLNRATVCFWKSTRSPTGREPHGDGDPIVVRGRESWPHGEAGQVDRNDKEPGRRDVKSRPPENPATGKPYAWKLARTVRGRADGKGAVRPPRQPPIPQSPAVKAHTRCYSVYNAASPGADRSRFADCHLRPGERWVANLLKGMSGTPTSCSIRSTPTERGMA